MSFHLSLDETACFYVDDSRGHGDNITRLYSLHFQRLQQEYPIRQRYNFAVPLLSSTCVCDCPGGDELCREAFAHRICSNPHGACYQLFHTHQSAPGCDAGTNSRVCCTLKLRPYQDKTFWALSLGRDHSTTAHFLLRQHRRDGDGWVEEALSHRSLSLAANSTSLVLQDLQLAISGQASSRSLSSGGLAVLVSLPVRDETSLTDVYVADEDGELWGGAPVNGQREWDLRKLGWFRRSAEGGWGLWGGAARLQQEHALILDNCKEHRYSELLLAYPYVKDGYSGTQNATKIQNFLGHRLAESSKRWLESAKVVDVVKDRTAVLVHRTSLPLSLGTDY